MLDSAMADRLPGSMRLEIELGGLRGCSRREGGSTELSHNSFLLCGIIRSCKARLGPIRSVLSLLILIVLWAQALAMLR